MANRRTFLQTLAGLPLFRKAAPATVTPKREFFKELGIRPVINGAGSYTFLTGSLMRPEALEAILATSKNFVRLDELHDAVGRRIASLVGSEAAMVTSGCASALLLSTAACITGDNADFIRRIPDTTGMKNEVLIQKAHHFGYEHAVRACGARLIDVETPEDVDRAAGERTAAMLFLNKADPDGKIQRAEFVALGKKHRVPTIIDAAADVPPVENLTKYVKMGFDVVCFSGGKGICGPQSAGLLFGRQDLVRAARMNTSPNSDTVGRGLKVNKEEMVGMMVALETYLKLDHRAEWNEWEKRIKLMSDTVSSVPGVSTERFVPPIANEVPHLRVRWDAARIHRTPEEIARALREGEPSIELVPTSYVSGTLEIAAWTLQPGEAQTVARRLREELART